MEDSKIQSFPRIKHSSGCWISCRKNVVMERLEEPTLDYDSWNPDEVAKHNCVRRAFDIYIEDPADGIGRALDLHEQLMKVLNDDSLPCDFTNNRWFHSGSEWNTIRNRNSAKHWYGSSAALFYNLFVWNSVFSTLGGGGGTRSWSRMQSQHMQASKHTSSGMKTLRSLCRIVLYEPACVMFC
jgi:hypothetical protein